MKYRVYLRALEPEDYKKSYKWRNDPEIQDLVGGHKYFVSSENEKNWVAKNTYNSDRIVLAICLKDNDKYIGNVMLQNFDWINRSCSAPFFIGDKSEWGKGYGTEARMLMLDFAFKERGMERISDLVIEGNEASRKLLLKCGYKEEGVMRNSVFKNGRFQNQIVMGLLKEDFIQAKLLFENKSDHK